MNTMRNEFDNWTKRVALSLVAIVGIFFFAGAAFADDWLAERLRGRVFVLTGAEWVPLHRGDVISDDRYIQTSASGRVTFMRDNETIELGGDTRVRIADNDGRRFTRVLQDFGTVSVEAEVEQVQHFSVETPTFAAVVKGTRFTVRTDGLEGFVSVQRGRVEVSDNVQHTRTNVAAGQRAEVSTNAIMEISGRGPKELVLNLDGTVAAQGHAGDGNSGNGNGNSGNGNSENGNGNSGSDNSGSDNSGSGNSGSGNSGSDNSGSGNSGSGNSGSGNSGSGNSGSGNSGNGNS